MSGAHASPHFYGILVAVVLLVVAAIWTARRRKAGRAVPHRSLIVAGGILILGLGVFGNGSTEDFARGLALNEALPRGATGDHLAAAVRVATSEPFLRYQAALAGEKLSFRPADLSGRLSFRIVRAPELGGLGVRMTPAPPADWRGVFFEYRDVENVALGWIGLGARGRAQRFLYVQDLANHHLSDLLGLEIYRAARTDQDRLDALEGIGRYVPHAAEWIARALRRSREAASEPVRRRIDQKLAHVQRYIDDPTMRGMPRGRHVRLR